MSKKKKGNGKWVIQASGLVKPKRFMLVIDGGLVMQIQTRKPNVIEMRQCGEVSAEKTSRVLDWMQEVITEARKL